MLLLLLLVVGGTKGFEQQGQTFSDVSVTSGRLCVDWHGISVTLSRWKKIVINHFH